VSSLQRFVVGWASVGFFAISAAHAGPNQWTISTWGYGRGGGGGAGPGGGGVVDAPFRGGDATIHRYTQGQTRTGSSNRLSRPSAALPDRHEPAGIDYDASGALFSLSSRTEIQLYRVHPTAGTMTPLIASPPQRSGLEGDLAFNPVDGMFYASLPAAGPAADIIVRIDPARGTLTPVGSFPTHDLSGLAIDSTGAMYGIDSHGGGQAELLKFVWSGAALSAVSYGSLGMTLGGMLGLDFDGTDALFAMAGSGGLYEIPTTLFPQPIARSDARFRMDDPVTGLAWTPVPEPTTLSMLLVGAALLARRREARVA